MQRVSYSPGGSAGGSGRVVAATGAVSAMVGSIIVGNCEGIFGMKLAVAENMC